MARDNTNQYMTYLNLIFKIIPFILPHIVKIHKHTIKSTNQIIMLIKAYNPEQNYKPFGFPKGHDNLRLLMLSKSLPFPSCSCLVDVVRAKSSKLDSFPQGGGVTHSEPIDIVLWPADIFNWESDEPNLSFWRVANDSLMAVIASKNLVHDANATGIGRSISYIIPTTSHCHGWIGFQTPLMMK